MEFNERLLMLRTQNRYTQEEIGKKIGVSKSAVNNYESGYRYPKKEQLEALADVFNVDLDYLTGRSDTPLKYSFDDDRLLHTFHKLNSRGKAAALEDLNRLASYPEYTSDSSMIGETISYQTDDLIPMLFAGYKAAAGKWVHVDDIEDGYIYVKKMPGADFIFGISGDSMEPDYSDGDKVYVHSTSTILPGEIGIFQIGNEFYIKEFTEGGLRSHNTKYSLIPKSNDIVVIGRVLGKVAK